MANGTSEAVDQATRLSEIGFPEFTAKLVNDVFNALVSANLSQMKAYVELLQAVSKTLTEYINDTQDDIGPAEILDFLVALVPDPNDPNNPTKVKDQANLLPADVAALNTALALPPGTIATPPPGTTPPTLAPIGTTASSSNQVVAPPAANATTTTLNATDVTAIMEAVARRIAANKYDLLSRMVNQGILQTVVYDGLIRSSLTFSTYGSNFYSKHESQYQRSDFNFAVQARSGRAVSRWINIAARANYTKVNVHVTNETTQAASSSNVRIEGLVELRIKTNYLALTP